MMSKSLIVLGHGSRRMEANEELCAIYEMVKEANPAWKISYAFVEFARHWKKGCGKCMRAVRGRSF